MKNKIIKWALVLSPWIIPALPFLFIDSTVKYWIGFVYGAAWMFWVLMVGKVFRELRGPRI